MTLKTQCPECGDWFSIGAKHAVGMPCRRCTQKKDLLADEIAATYPKPKCHVFGCTIPRGIPHEHPAGVSAVMRDPFAPLTANERAELEACRYLAATKPKDEDRLDDLIKESLLIQKAAMPEKPMTGGRKLRDALPMAGTSSTVRSTATVDGVQVVTEATYGPAPRNLDLRNDRLGTVITGEWECPKCPPLVRTVGRFMAWIFGTVALCIIWPFTVTVLFKMWREGKL